MRRIRSHLHVCESTGEWDSRSNIIGQINTWKCVFDLFVIYIRGVESPPFAPQWHEISTGGRSITWRRRPGQWGSLSSSYLLTQLMEVCICISLSEERGGELELDGRQAGRGLSHCTNETIHHSFVCLYAPSHEQLMCCRRFGAFLLFLYLTFPLFVSLSRGGGLSLQHQPFPADCNFRSIY